MKKKPTEALKQKMLITTILPALHWSGAQMMFPYRENFGDELQFAVIKLSDLIKIIKYK